jgi:hypothetical protein
VSRDEEFGEYAHLDMVPPLPLNLRLIDSKRTT